MGKHRLLRPERALVPWAMALYAAATGTAAAADAAFCCLIVQGLSLAPGAALSLAAGRLVNPRRLKGAALEALGLWALGSLILCLLPDMPPLPGRVSRLAGVLTALCALTAEILACFDRPAAGPYQLLCAAFVGAALPVSEKTPLLLPAGLGLAALAGLIPALAGAAPEGRLGQGPVSLLPPGPAAQLAFPGGDLWGAVLGPARLRAGAAGGLGPVSGPGNAPALPERRSGPHGAGRGPGRSPLRRTDSGNGGPARAVVPAGGGADGAAPPADADPGPGAAGGLRPRAAPFAASEPGSGAPDFPPLRRNSGAAGDSGGAGPHSPGPPEPKKAEPRGLGVRFRQNTIQKETKYHSEREVYPP